MSSAEHDMWDGLNIEYEQAYGNNPFKKACVQEAIGLLKPGSRVLDVGCGTGVPTSQLLAEAGMKVEGIDVAPRMVEHARRRVKGVFASSDMESYAPWGSFAGIFIIYSQLGLSYSSFCASVYKLAKTLKPGGLLVIGQSPADPTVPKDDPKWDETGTYVEGYNLPFWGEPFATLMFSREGQKRWLKSLGLDVVYETLDLFQPDHEKCDAEYQQYVIARWKGEGSISKPMPLPG